MNNKGFTLVELLAVLVILTAIMSIAIPTITSSMERQKEKINKDKQKMLESYAEMYVTDHKNKVSNMLSNNSKVINICISDLESYLTEDAKEDADGNTMNGYIQFTWPNSYKYVEGVFNGPCLE